MTTVRRNIWQLGTRAEPLAPHHSRVRPGVSGHAGAAAERPAQLDLPGRRSTAPTHDPAEPARPGTTASTPPGTSCPGTGCTCWQFERILRSLLPALLPGGATSRRRLGAAVLGLQQRGARQRAAAGVPRPDVARRLGEPAVRRPAPAVGERRSPHCPARSPARPLALAETAFTRVRPGRRAPASAARATGFAHQGPAFGELEASAARPGARPGGRRASGLMTDPNTAALDPIFWLHHANIDRLWEVWNIGGGAKPDHQRWLDRSFPLRDAGRPYGADAAAATCWTSSASWTTRTKTCRWSPGRHRGGACRGNGHGPC